MRLEDDGGTELELTGDEPNTAREERVATVDEEVGGSMWEGGY